MDLSEEVVRNDLCESRVSSRVGCLPCENLGELLVQEGCPLSDETVPRDSLSYSQHQLECSGENSFPAHTLNDPLRGQQHGRVMHGGSTRGRRGRRQRRAEVEK